MELNKAFGAGLLTGLSVASVIACKSWHNLALRPHRRLLGFAASIIAFGTLGFMWLDNQTVVDAFYCSCITLTTVGYGDVCPMSRNVEVKAFVVVLALSGIGVICGPFLTLVSECRACFRCGEGSYVEVLTTLLALVTLSVGLFCTLEGWDVADAIYFAVITGTTIGYGDHVRFKTDEGKIAAAFYSIISVGAFGWVTSKYGDLVSTKIGLKMKRG